MADEAEDLAGIRSNADMVVEQFGSSSGLDRFGFDAPSVQWVDGFIERQRVREDVGPEFVGKRVSVLGSYLANASSAHTAVDGRSATRVGASSSTLKMRLSPSQKSRSSSQTERRTASTASSRRYRSSSGRFGHPAPGMTNRCSGPGPRRSVLGSKDCLGEAPASECWSV